MGTLRTSAIRDEGGRRRAGAKVGNFRDNRRSLAEEPFEASEGTTKGIQVDMHIPLMAMGALLLVAAQGLKNLEYPFVVKIDLSVLGQRLLIQSEDFEQSCD